MTDHRPESNGHGAQRALVLIIQFPKGADNLCTSPLFNF